jgi:hypothetical protein
VNKIITKYSYTTQTSYRHTTYTHPPYTAHIKTHTYTHTRTLTCDIGESVAGLTSKGALLPLRPRSSPEKMAPAPPRCTAEKEEDEEEAAAAAAKGEDEEEERAVVDPSGPL